MFHIYRCWKSPKVPNTLCFNEGTWRYRKAQGMQLVRWSRFSWPQGWWSQSPGRAQKNRSLFHDLKKILVNFVRINGQILPRIWELMPMLPELILSDVMTRSVSWLISSATRPFHFPFTSPPHLPSFTRTSYKTKTVLKAGKSMPSLISFFLTFFWKQ